MRGMHWLVAAALAILGTVGSARAQEPGLLVYVGTYTGAKSQGIYALRMDAATGRLGEPVLAAEVKNPSFVALHPSGRTLYAVGELDNFNGKKGGAISAFSVDPASGKLTLLNQQTSGGGGPCFVTVDATGKAALLANYGGGSVESLPIKEDGSLGEPASFVQHAGSSVNASRQKGPHAHSINLSPDNRFAFAADLGLDKILVYKFDPATAKLAPHEPASAPTPPGGGPRHFSFHPNGRFAYVINEMGMSVTAFSYDAAKGELTTLHTVGTLPPGAESSPRFSTAEVLVHPSGKFVYGSNRGHDSITCFKVDEQTGKLTYAGNYPSGGKTPRNFRIDPMGRFLLAAHQDSDSIVVHKIDGVTGALAPAGFEAKVGRPVCIKFWRGVTAAPAK